MAACIRVVLFCTVCLLLEGCPSRDDAWRAYRLGEATERFELARDVRQGLVRGGTTKIPAEQLARCHIRGAYANQSEDSGVDFRIRGLNESGESTVYWSASSGATYGWKKYGFVLGSRPPISLIFESSSDNLGIWSRPIATCPVHSRKPDLRNVIVVSLDTLRADQLGVYGSKKGLTPHLDETARAGTFFNHAYAQFPSTLSSHATLFTGMYPSQHGLLPSVDARLTPDHHPLAMHFADAGYGTVAFTENAFVSSAYGFDLGFDVYHNGPVANELEMFPGESRLTFARAFDWLRGRPPGPFFMFLHTYEVHSPYLPYDTPKNRGILAALSKGYKGRFESVFTPWDELAHNAGTEVLSEEEMRRVRALYDAETSDLDEQFGLLLSVLAELGLVESTLLVVTSDHGEEFGEHGFIGHGETLHEQALRVPLIFYFPGTVPSGRRIPGAVGLIDVGPTILSMAGLPNKLGGRAGRDLSKVIVGDNPVGKEFVVSELNINMTSCPEGLDEAGNFGEPCRYDGLAVRDDRYSYIVSSALGSAELFDRDEDSQELANITDARPTLVETYAAYATEHREKHGERVVASQPTEVDPITTDRLRSLGYIE